MTVIGEEKRKKGGRVSVTLRVYSPLVFKKKKKKITHFLLMMPRGVTRCKKALFHELSQMAEREVAVSRG